MVHPGCYCSLQQARGPIFGIWNPEMDGFQDNMGTKHKCRSIEGEFLRKVKERYMAATLILTLTAYFVIAEKNMYEKQWHGVS